MSGREVKLVLGETVATGLVIGNVLWVGRSIGSGLVDIQLAAFAVGLLLLVIELMEVELPRGDPSTMASPVLAVAAVHLGIYEALFVVLLPTMALLALDVARKRMLDGVHGAFRRLLVVGLGIFVVRAFANLGVSDVLVWLEASGFVVCLDFLVAQGQTSYRKASPLFQTLAAGARLQGTILAANVSSALVGVMLYPEIGYFGLLALGVLLLLMRQAFSSLVALRRAYQSTIEALARTIEAQNPNRQGHSERVAALATESARQLGMHGRSLERIAYASLLHDLGEIGTDETDEPDVRPRESRASVMVAGVSFLEDVIPLLSLCEDDSGEVCAKYADSDELRMAYIVLAASRTDDMAKRMPTARDEVRMRLLAAHLPSRALAKIEMAFRAASANVSGTLFAYGDSRAGQE